MLPTPDQIKGYIESNLDCEHVHVVGDGSHFEAVVVSNAFEGKRLIQRHQLVYGALGEALAARRRLSTALLGTAELRFGIGGGEVRIIDAERGIQDGTAWWLAREAINAVEELAADPGYRTARTVIRDERGAATPGVDALVRLAEAAVARLRDGARRSFEGLLAGLPNEDVARAEDISPSANSQRVVNNDLRILADAVVVLEHLP